MEVNIPDDELLRECTAFMQRWHKGQVDKGGSPYHLHPESVSAHCDGLLAKVAGLFHDLLEDTYCEAWDIREFLLQRTDEEFADAVVNAVILLTHKKTDGMTYFQYIQNIIDSPGVAGFVARAVKLADVTDNNRKDRGYYSESLEKRNLKTLEMLNAARVAADNNHNSGIQKFNSSTNAPS